MVEAEFGDFQLSRPEVTEHQSGDGSRDEERNDEERNFEVEL